MFLYLTLKESIFILKIKLFILIATLVTNFMTEASISNEKEVCTGCGCTCPCDCTDCEECSTCKDH